MSSNAQIRCTFVSAKTKSILIWSLFWTTNATT